jgi:hypothetical protein
MHLSSTSPAGQTDPMEVQSFVNDMGLIVSRKCIQSYRRWLGTGARP